MTAAAYGGWGVYVDGRGDCFRTTVSGNVISHTSDTSIMQRAAQQTVIQNNLLLFGLRGCLFGQVPISFSASSGVLHGQGAMLGTLPIPASWRQRHFLPQSD